MNIIKRLTSVCVFWLFACIFCYGQNNSRNSVVFPQKNTRKWAAAYGLTFMTTPRAVTEEFHRRVPAGEFYGTKYISEKFYFTPRLRFQILQNEFILGLGYLLHQNSKWGFSAEVSGSVWAGVFKTEAYNRKGYGFMGYPAVKAGFKLKEDLMLTMKGELILNLARRDVAGQISQSLPSPFYSGEAISFYVEQPFFKKTSVILGFRGMYCDFYWQTWTLNENFERNIFYPEIIIELIL